MKVLLIADGRSPITAHWIDSISKLNIQVSLISTYPCKRPVTVADFAVLPVAFARFSGSQAGKAQAPASQQPVSQKRELVKKFRDLFMKVRYVAGPVSVALNWYRLRRLVAQMSPDLVHALRIPFEGMLGMGTPKGIPFVVSIWGNDLTLHAKGSLLMRLVTRLTLNRADGLLSDTARDIRLARMWGLDEKKPVLEVPGNGGISFSDIRSIAADGKASLYWLPDDRHVVINPRGFRPGSVRNDTFFKSIPLVLAQFPDTLFLCCSMAGQPEAQGWIERLKIEKNVVLLPTLKQADLWPLFMRAEVTVTVSQHDGTPNSLLEAMTLGCFPVAGDIESMREWITPGINGMLVNPDDPAQLASAVINALTYDTLREQAAEKNAEIIRKRAEISVVSPAICVFYRSLTE